MEIQNREDQEKPIVSPETGYSWTKDQLDDYEMSWARDHDHQE